MTRHPLPTLLLLLSVATLSACTWLRPETGPMPLSQETADNLQPGLLPRYFEKFFARNVAELPDDDTSRFKNWLGEPIPQLDNQFGIGKVFGSGTNRGIGIRMRGALHFPAPGTYTFQALSNDGIMMYLGDTLVVNDPTQHSDQLSKESSIQIPAAGWYPLRIDYFQRKGTAALKLYWKTPGSDAMSVVPASVYGHIPAS